jgi:sugar phosphate permease
MKLYILGMLCCMAVIAYVQRLAFGVSEEHIRGSLDFTKPQIGEILAAWQLGYALMQIPCGWLADRLGSRRTLVGLVLVWSSLMVGAAWCTTYTSMLCVWGLMGMVQAGAFPCATKLIGDKFEPSFRATASGFLASSMALGIALAPLLTTQLLNADWAWHHVFVIFAVPGWIWAMVFLTTIRPETSRRAAEGSANPQRWALQASVSTDWRQMLFNVSLWLLCAQQFFRAAAMMFFQSWFPTFLRETRGVDLAESGFLAFYVGLGAMLGGLCGGLFSDWLLVRTGNRRLARQGIAIAGMLSCAFLVGLSYFIADTQIAIACVSLGAFLATFGGVSGYTVAIDFGGRHVATTFSLMNTCGNIGAAMFPLLVGYLAISSFGWNSVLVLCVVILIIDAICWGLLNPRMTISGEPLGHANA